jgi:hypothetical protein
MVTVEQGTYSIELFHKADEDNSFHLKAEVRPSGELVLVGNDCGTLPLSCFGDADYEYWRSVRAEDVPKVLLWLLKEQFTSDVAFAEWCRQKGIHTGFFSYI